MKRKILNILIGECPNCSCLNLRISQLVSCWAVFVGLFVMTYTFPGYLNPAGIIWFNLIVGFGLYASVHGLIKKINLVSIFGVIHNGLFLIMMAIEDWQ